MIIGITGGSGSGKSSLAALFAHDGFRIIDCDALVHELYTKSEYVNAVCAAFPSARTADGIDRKKLAELVFSDKTELERLNSIVLPLVCKAVLDAANAECKHRNVIIDAPTLFEAGLDEKCDIVIGVIASEAVRTARITARDSISEAQAHDRIASQKSDDFYRTHCDITICNNGERELSDIYAELKKMIGVY